MKTYTLLIWETNPEGNQLYLIPNEEVEKDNRLELMTQAHGCMINCDYENEGMTFLNEALEANGVFEKYRRDWDVPISGVTITRVIMSGFML